MIILKKIWANFKEKVFNSVIPRSVSVVEASMKGLPVNEYRPSSSAAVAYAALAREVMAYLEKNRP